MGKSSKRVARNISRAEVLRAIRGESPISRSRLAQLVPVSRATVSGIVAELIQAGVLHEVGRGTSTGGRRPIKLSYRPESRMVLGIVAFDDEISATLTDMEGHPIDQVGIPLLGGSPGDMLQAMQKAAEALLTVAPQVPVLGVGVGAPGIVDSRIGTIEISASKGWLQGTIQVKDYLQNALQLPVYVANRSRVAALGEFKIGVGQGFPNLVYLFIGQGIAAGIVIDGQLYSGPNSSAGEIGHVSVVPDGPLCTCGNRGCLEIYAAERAILAESRAMAREDLHGLLRKAMGDDPDRLTVQQVIQAAAQGDRSAEQTLADAGLMIGIAVSHIIDLFNPEMVIIGGPIGCTAGDLLLAPVTEEARRRTLPRPFAATKIVSGSLGAHAAAIGAAVLAMNGTPVEAIFGD